MIPNGTMTADELRRLEIPGRRAELVRGVLTVREPAGYRHGEVAAELARRLANHAIAEDLGRVLAAETGFKLASDPDTVRAPDIAFVGKERLPDPSPLGYAELSPDLVIEITSPEDRPGAVLGKVGDWLQAGSALVWVVDPGRRFAHVYRADGSESIIDEHGVLDGEDVLPGFRLPLQEIF